MIEKDRIRLVQDGLLWLLKKHFLGTKITDLYHLSYEVARYKRAQVSKGTNYQEMATMAPQQVNDSDLDTLDE